MKKILEKERDGKHIFGQKKHRFEEFGVKGKRATKKVLKKIVKKLVKIDKQGGLSPDENGVFKEGLKRIVKGRPAEVRGRLIDKELNPSTAYIPKGVK